MLYERKKIGEAMPTEEELQIAADEKVADEAGLAEVKEDELRNSIAEELDIDPEMEGELLDKLVEKETKSRKVLSKTIKQKIGYREKAEGSKKPEGDKPPKDGKKPAKKPEDKLDFDEKFEAKMAERDLKELALPEEIESEVRTIAKVKKISIREAAKHPLITMMKEDAEKEERIKNSSPSRGNKGARRKVDLTKPLNAEDFDLSSKEGRKAWNEARAAKDKQRSEE